MSDSDNAPFEIVHPRLIICEGAGDQAFFSRLIEKRNLPSFSVCHPGGELTQTGGWLGFADLLNALPLKRGWKNLKGILIVSDNDDDPSTSFDNVRAQINRVHGFVAPPEPLAVSRQAGFPAIAVSMLPTANEPGALETLCLAAATKKNPQVGECVERLISCAGITDWKGNRLLKMRMRCVLAATCPSDPNTSLVHAWSKDRGNPIPLEDSSFNAIAEVLQHFDRMAGID